MLNNNELRVCQKRGAKTHKKAGFYGVAFAMRKSNLKRDLIETPRYAKNAAA